MKTSNKGITLVILVIIIIVMSILAATSIITITDSNIIGFANSTVNENNINNIREAAEIAYNSLLIENMGDTASISEDLIKQKIIETGINESDLQGLSFELGETLRVGYKQVINNSATLNNNMSGRLSFKILGNSVQNGEPSPSTPIEIHSVGEKTVNLLPDTVYDINAYGEDYGQTYATVYKLPFIESGKTYTLSLNYEKTTDVTYYYLCYYNIDDGTGGLQKHLITNTTPNGKVTYTFTAEEGKEYYFYSNHDRYLHRAVADISEFQIQEGNIATSYEPYGYKIPITVTNSNGTTTHNIYLDEPLRKVGEYEDYIDFSSKTLYRIIGTKATNFQFHGQTGEYLYLKNITSFSDKNPNIIAGLSNKILKFTTFPGSADNNKLMMNGNMYYYCVAATEDEKQTYIDLLENTEIYYVLNELSSSKIELPEIYTTSGNTTITIDTETNPSEIELFYQYN